MNKLMLFICFFVFSNCALYPAVERDMRSVAFYECYVPLTARVCDGFKDEDKRWCMRLVRDGCVKGFL